MNETVLINVKLEGTENEGKVNSLSESINKLNEENKKLIESNKALAKAEGDNSAEMAKNSSQIELNKQKIGESTAVRKGLIQTIVAEDNSIKGLTVRNAELRKQRDLINTSTEEGRKKIAAINTEIDKNNNTIKDNNDLLGKQKINIGNYASALDGVIPGLSGMVTGIQASTKAAIAFIATPLGAVIGALGLALGAIVSFFKQSTTAADFLEDVLAGVSATVNVLTDRLTAFVGGLVKIAQGDFGEGLDDIAGSFKGIGDEIEREIELAAELAGAIRDLEDAEIDYGIKAAETENQIKRLLLQAKNRTLTEQERIKFLDQALALEKGLNEELIKNADEGLRIANEEAAVRLNLKKGLLESEVSFGKRIIEELKKDGALVLDTERDLIAERLKARANAEGQSLALQERVQNQRDALAEKEEARIAKEVEKLLATKTESIESDLKIQEEYQERSIELTTSFNESILAVNDSFRKKNADNQKKQNDLILKQEDAKQKGLEQLQNQALMVGFQLAGRSKGLQSALTLTSTYFSAQKAYESQFVPIAEATSPIRGAIAAALAVVSGLGRVAAINGIQFAQGGILNGPSHAMGGIPFSVGGRVGFEAEGGEAIINKRSTAMFAPILSQINQAGGGKAFATGGIAGNEVRSAYNYAQMFPGKSTPMTNTVLVLEDFEAKASSKYQTINKAQVL